MKKLRQWIAKKFGRLVSRGTIRKILKRAKLSWKKCKKLLGKANPQKRAEFLKQFETLYEQMCQGKLILIYVDESHFHRDLDLGYTWGPVGERAWRISDCPGLSEKINWYGAYNFTQGQCLIWNEGNCNTQHTSEFLSRVAEWVGSTDRRVAIIWDGAPWHRANVLKDRARELGLELVQLPGYSPDLNAIEGLWKWMREDVTQHHCHETLRALFDACQEFIELVNNNPEDIVKRLWPKFELDPELEKLRVSN